MQFTIMFRELTICANFNPYLEWVSSVPTSDGHYQWLAHKKMGKEHYLTGDIFKALEHFDLMGLFSKGYMDPIFIVVHPSNAGSQDDLDRLQDDFFSNLGHRAIVIKPYFDDESGIIVDCRTNPSSEDT